MIPEYLFYNSAKEDEHTWVDISELVERKVNAGAKYVSQFGPGWKNSEPFRNRAEAIERIDTRVRENEKREARRRIPLS